jgi:hypothetical protein
MLSEKISVPVTKELDPLCNGYQNFRSVKSPEWEKPPGSRFSKVDFPLPGLRNRILLILGEENSLSTLLDDDFVSR